MAVTLHLGQGTRLDVHEGEVVTYWPDGHAMAAQRADTAENRAEAASQGYEGEAAVWRSLVEHEALHTLVSRAVYGRESIVLRHECGAEPAVYAQRLHEESVVLAFQRWLNTGDVWPALGPYVALAPVIADQLRRLVPLETAA